MHFTIEDAIQVIRNKVCSQIKIPDFELKPVGSGNRAYWIDLPGDARLYLSSGFSYANERENNIIFRLVFPKTVKIEPQQSTLPINFGAEPLFYTHDKLPFMPQEHIKTHAGLEANLNVSDFLATKITKTNFSIEEKDYDTKFKPLVGKGVEIAKGLIKAYLNAVQPVGPQTYRKT